VFLKLNPRRNLGRNKQRRKLQLHFIGPFPIVQRIGNMAYRLALPSEFQGIHNVFHVSQLRQYITDPDHVVNDKVIELTLDLSYVERLIQKLNFSSTPFNL
jgi:hypothetical protein